MKNDSHARKNCPDAITLLKSLNFRYALIRKNNKAQMGALMLDKQ
jgi:hypothetical protein